MFCERPCFSKLWRCLHRRGCCRCQASLEADIAQGKVTGSLRPQKRRQIIRLYRELLRRLGHPDDSYEFAYEIYAGYALLPHNLFDDVLPTLHQLQARNIRIGVYPTTLLLHVAQSPSTSAAFSPQSVLQLAKKLACISQAKPSSGEPLPKCVKSQVAACM